ncbi:uncharacterized protein AC631_05746 [Debaryomyces fabryi]|uniref:Uncharacterized protein n=1 Tax=Debaryomyces fabryi TaxID=58627 RepID=A0A0V1PQQ2_9ASCO|nr:uncharacterized protein AC631_05746 [Debaryomyces fabryi]KRZ98495.1 hypothetical protein AC631_05746 [Debaryomyces fabryi]CUM46024.1 unnamed protein product [Debaryomyces fabryi]
MSDNHKEVQELVAGDDVQNNPEQQPVETNETGEIVHRDVNDLNLEETNEESGEMNEQTNVGDLGADESPEFGTGPMDWEPLDQENSNIPQVNLTTENQENEVPLVPGFGLDHQDHYLESQGQQNQDQQTQEQQKENQETVDHINQEPVQQHEQQTDHHEEEQENEDDINTSILHPPQSNQSFTTPLKSLPPLKDIEPITTPKAFSVAKDSDINAPNVSSSPLITHKNTNMDLERDEDYPNVNNTVHQENGNEDTEKSVVRAFLGVNQQDLNSFSVEVISKLHKKSIEFQELKSDNEFLKINQEQAILIQNKKSKLVSLKLDKLDKQNAILKQERDTLSNEKEIQIKTINELRDENTAIRNKLSEIELQSKKYDSNYSDQIGERDQEILKLNDSLNKLTKTNIEQNQKINEVIKELNDTRNEKFSLKLETSKLSNEISYVKNQRKWYEEELKSVQQRFTDLIKKHETEFLMRSNKLSSLTTKNETLERLNKSQADHINALQNDLEKEISKASSLESKLEIEKIKISKELKNKEELLELTQVQSSQRNERIGQLESYIDEIKNKLGESINALETDLFKKNEAIVVLEEKLRRTEDVLDKELHKETELPKLSVSAEMISSTKTDGISLSSLYSEYNHLKKQLVLERSQKERLANQLESFVTELESKKPIIANYSDQIKFYENSLQEMIGKVESIRLEKLEGEKEYNKLKSRLAEYNNDLVSMKKLCKDLGKQLCYYLIHSKIRDSNEDPLTLAERKAIENILERSGNNDGLKESDTDQLISDRLVGFANIIELQQKNEGLLTVVRQLGKKLESKDDDFNGGLESAAIDEAKEAILTLENELDSVHIKLEAVSKERDVFKSMVDSTTNNGPRGEFKYLADANNDLKAKLHETEKILKDLQLQSSTALKEFNDKLRETTNSKNELILSLSSMKHSADLAEARFSNSQKSLANAREEIDQYKKDIQFWKNQASKQETLLVNKSNELKDVENKLNEERLVINNLNTQKEMWHLYQKTMNDDIVQLRSDKSHLNEFVVNLQSLLKERETSSKELSNRLAQSIENYQTLQDKLSEKEERISILTNQSQLALRAQNSKLEQINELNQALLDYKNKIAEKNSLIENLTRKAEELEDSHSSTNTLQGFKNPSIHSDHPNQLSENYEKELERTRNDLRIAESQVSEFSDLAKAAELALTNSTNTFENYKTECESKLDSLLKEKELLKSELDNYSRLLNQSKQETIDIEKKYRTEAEEFKLKIEESIMKANAYDDLKKDYELKIQSVTRDMESQSKISSENQKKYRDELQRNSELTNEVDILKNKCDNLETNVSQLTTKLNSTQILLDKKNESIEEEKQSFHDELVSSRLKVKDLQDQNNVLLNQLELSKLAGTSDVSETSSNDDLREVVSYLRREKDSAEAKLVSYTEDHQRLEQHLKQVTSELEATKSELSRLRSNINVTDGNNKEHNRLLDQLQQLNILRESNTTLRNENAVNIQRISDLENELQSVALKLEPLEKKISELSMQNEVKEQTIRLIKEENEKNRSHLESNAGRDVAESEVEDIKAMKQRFTNLKNEFQNKLLAHRSKTKELEKTVESLKVELANSRSDMERNNEAMQNEKISDTSNEIASVHESYSLLKKESEDRIKSLVKEKESLESTLQSLKLKIDNLESGNSNKKFEEQLHNLKAQFENEKVELRKKIEDEFDQRLKEELAKVNKIVLDNQKNEKEDETRIKLESEFEEKNAELEKKFQERQSQLEHELRERFERNLKEKVDEEVSRKMTSGETNGDTNHVRDELLKQHEVEISKLKQDFDAQLNQAKEDVKNVTEKKFEIKLRMLNKKLDKLEGNRLKDLSVLPSNNTSTDETKRSSVSSLPATPNLTQDSAQSPTGQERPKLPLGHQFTESTLTVHRPSIDRSNLSSKTVNTQKPTVEKLGQKRPMVNKNQTTNKRTKE